MARRSAADLPSAEVSQAAIDQQAALGVHQQLVAGASDAALGAVVQDVGVIHVVAPLLVR
jgi:hypothetical protein